MRLRLTLILLCSLGALSAGSNPRFEKTLDEIRANLKPEEAMRIMGRVYATDRYFTFPRFEQTAAYLKDEMRTLGLRNVEIVNAPADGITQVGFWTMPLAWDAKSARLEILDVTVPPGERILATPTTRVAERNAVSDPPRACSS